MEMPSVSGLRDGRCARRSNWAGAGERSPGVGTGRQSKRDGQPKQGRSRRSPRALPPSEGPRYKRRGAVKPVGAGETGGSGRSGDEGRDSIPLPERRTRGVQRRGYGGGLFRNVREGYHPGSTKGSGTRRHAKGRGKPGGSEGMPGVDLTSGSSGQAWSEKLALKPYWGKPTVRNFRGGGGNVGIIRSPNRATALPDPGQRRSGQAGSEPCLSPSRNKSGICSNCEGIIRPRPVSISTSPCGWRTSTAFRTESHFFHGEPPRYANAELR